MFFTDPTTPTARKAHLCSTCGRRIEPGETYCRCRGYDGGDAWTFRQCAHCAAVSRLYDPRDSDDLISEDGHRCWTENGARDLAELRAMAGYRMRWRTRSGALTPIPTNQQVPSGDPA